MWKYIVHSYMVQSTYVVYILCINIFFLLSLVILSLPCTGSVWVRAMIKGCWWTCYLRSLSFLGLMYFFLMACKFDLSQQLLCRQINLQHSFVVIGLTFSRCNLRSLIDEEAWKKLYPKPSSREEFSIYYMKISR